MILHTIKNFIINLKYYFIPLGTLFLGLILGFSIAIPGIYRALQDALNSLKLLITGVDIDPAAFFDSLYAAVRSFDWHDPVAAVKMMLDAAWLKQTFLNAAMAFFQNRLPDYANEIDAIYRTLLGEVKAYVIVVAVWAILGIFAGFLLTKTFIRKTIARRGFIKALLVPFLDALLSTTVVALCIWLITVWLPGGIITIAAYLILSAFIHLLEAHVIHSWKKLKLKQIVNVKNCLLLLLTNLIVIALSIGLTVLAMVATNPFAGLMIGLPFVEIAFLVSNLTAESYVIHRVEKECGTTK